ncbi:MAG: rRNA methyltransferase [Rickettsiaceae bacterium]|nr:rRNA methyltransferase [Rickettsiaceae bacterium]
MGENIGAAARVMLNFGITDLRLVNPRDGWPNPKAEDMAKSAKQVIDNAQVFLSLADAAHDIQRLYATTARPRDMVKTVVTPRKCAEEIHKNEQIGEKCAIMFGPEQSGLDNEDIAMADAIVTIPVSPLYTSLNLAQAVSLLCYEHFTFSDATSPEKLELGKYGLASKLEITKMLEHLELELDNTHFFKAEDKRPGMVKNIRNMFIRANLTEQDVRTLRGIIKSLTNAE